MRRLCFLNLLLASSSVILIASPRNGEKLEFRKSHTVPFVSSGTIRIPNSFGELRIEAWDRDEIQIDLVKRTNRRYEQSKEHKAIDHLENVDVRFERHGEDDLTILTYLPNRSWKRPLRGETNLQLTYRIKAPRNAKLEIKHGIGLVSVKEIAGEMNITAKIGEIAVLVPDSSRAEDYQIDARVRIGDVESDFSGKEQRRKLVGAAFHAYEQQPTVSATARRLSLRVGIGAISVHRHEP
jgi:hypothetical protein